MPVAEQRAACDRIVDGERNGLEADLQEALSRRSALEIINDTLLDQLMGLSGAFAFLLPRLPAALQRYFNPVSKPAP